MSSCVLTVSFAWNGCALQSASTPRVLHTVSPEQLSLSRDAPSLQINRDRLTTVTVRDGPFDVPWKETESHRVANEPTTIAPHCDTSSSNNIPYFIVEIDAPYFGDAPPPGAVRGEPFDGLWNYEVVELFIASIASMQSRNGFSSDASVVSDISSLDSTAAGASTPVRPDAPHYLELELSPHGAHLVLQLDDVRRVRASKLQLPYSDARIDGDRWHGA
jgi:hypothetical protein